jgi:CheY-like chemotaxis protein
MEAVGRLAGGVAHDFNNLLTVISGYSDIILEDLESDSAIHSDVTEILKASDRAASLTRQLLAFSRRQVLKLRLISLGAVVSEAEKMLRSLIGEGIDLVTEIEPGLGSVRADAGQMEQVILNLAVNAHDAMPNGGRIRIETKNVDLDESFVSRHPYAQTGPHVLLTVSDTGIGMDEETRLRVFEPFFTTKEIGKGTGLGLSTVYGIVKQSGGCIWVESGRMAGTSVHVCLPRVDQPADEVPSRLVTAREQGGSETVLLVEDEPSVRTMVRRILEDEGYTVIEAGEGYEAFEVASRQEQAIRLLLTDVVMPRMGGRELARRLAPVHPEMKVIYMTGYTDQAISDAPFLHKPFTSKSLLAKLREVLDSTSVRQEVMDEGD